MAFTKAFPKRSDKSAYPRWEDLTLSDEEEKRIEDRAREENLKIMSECIDDARKMFIDKNMKEYQTNVIAVAIALFEKRASHSVYWKENELRELFEKKK
jgi:hypothetical protein